MFGGIFQIVTDRDGHRHFYAYTDSAAVATLLVIALLLFILLISTLCYYLTRFIMLWIVGRLARGERRKWLQAAVKHKVFDRLAPLVPAYLVYLSAPLISGLSFPVVYLLGAPLATLAACYMVLTILRAAFAFLASIEDRYSHFPHASERPIKSFLQVATIVLYLAALIALISVLLHRSPTYFLTGVSAMTALLIIIFRDSLLGFVASIQLAAYDMLRVGDWIEVPGFVADGTVVDIALNTITVRNFDNAIVTIPSYVLLSNGVKNWRGMVESGGRRLKHEIHLDVDSIRFGDDELFAKLQASTDLQTPLILAEEDPRLTNLGIFRRYLTGYFRQHPTIRTDMPLVIRLLQSTDRGLPLELFLYIDDTDWESFERIQSDMLDHVYGVLPQFGLRVWQKR
ncbi:miniconductance mechanosensitive channel [Paraburkholderia sp. GAS41]|jgi:miniconductance mechanosensitive channel|uniref:mechanosensitive ion channel family protein n=1 Tax=Paraburkholderia sp. GAS41 TaxID=3035134 RepID=UPI003D21F268